LEFNQQFLTKLEYLYLVSRKVFSGRMRAERRTKKTGSGVEFADHRDYAAGDDLRYLDWSAYGRLDKLLLRLFEEEEDLHVYLLVDRSASMADHRKLEYASTVAAALAYVSLAKLDRVSIVPMAAAQSGVKQRRLPPARGKGNIFKVFRFLEELRPTGETDLATSVAAFVHETKRRGIAVVVSDFYDPKGYEDALNLLRYHRFETTAIQIWSNEEAHPSIRGDVRLVDVETGEAREVTVSERALRAYEAAHQQLTDGLQAFCTQRGIGCFRADTRVPFDELVLRLFRQGGLLA
jgi:uncharacterized protein (DUF58 family)